MALFLVSSVFQNTGIAKASGKPYSMGRCTVQVPFQDRETANFQSRGLGTTTVELSVANNIYDDLFKQFAGQFKKLPVPMELETSLDGEGRNIVIGFKASPVSAVA